MGPNLKKFILEKLEHDLNSSIGVKSYLEHQLSMAPEQRVADESDDDLENNIKSHAIYIANLREAIVEINKIDTQI